MGVVYRAEDVKLNRTVALKFLSPEFVSDGDRRQRFLREARTEASLSHPAIAAVYEVDESAGVVFIAMEFVGGRTLRETIGGRPLTLGQALRIGCEMAEALAYAHGNRVIHRDLKPENVMVRGDGHVKILDFGLAKLLRDSGDPPPPDLSQAETMTAELTREMKIMGTPAYMAPEQARGEPADPRADVFAMGTMLYEMLTGRNPFRREGVQETLRAVMHGEAAPANTVNPDVPRDLADIVSRCLEKDRERRYGSAAALLEDLAKVQLRQTASEAGLAADPAPPAGAWQRPGMLRPGMLLAAIGVAAAVVGMLTWGPLRRQILGGGAASAATSIAVLPFENRSADRDVDYIADGLTDRLISNLSQVSDLRVMASGTVTSYARRAGGTPDPRDAGRELAVTSVLTGRVERRGSGLMISVELIEPGSGVRLWGDTFRGEPDEIVDVESIVARQIARSLQIQITSDTSERLATLPTRNAEAYQIYLRGRHQWNKRDEPGMKAALDLYRQAVDLDPTFALGYLGIGEAYYGMSSLFLHPQEAMPKVRAAAQKALELDPDLAEAHTLLAVVRAAYDWDWAGAEQAHRRALELSPSHVWAHLHYAHYLMAMCRSEEAEREALVARDLDPLTPFVSVGAAWPLVFAHPSRRQAGQAVEILLRILKTDPGFSNAHLTLGYAYIAQGDYEKAIVSLRRSVALAEGSALELADLGFALAMSGNHDEAREVLGQVEQRRETQYLPPYAIALIHLALRDEAAGVQWMRRAYDERDEPLMVACADPRLEKFLDHPGISGIISLMGFPEGVCP